MPSIEKKCKWYFPLHEEGVDEQNTTDADEETLKNQSSVDALVRESIQNSLDAHDRESQKPVVVRFKFGSIQNPQESIPAFLEIEEHIKGAKEYILSRGNKAADLYFDPMLTFFNSHRDRFPYLCVSDSNTIGMDYSKEGRSRFFSFMNKGFNDKNDNGSGGSYGIGKAAYYMFSEIRSILISSMYRDESGENRTVFKGSSKLTTHTFRGVKLYNKGHYDVTKATPVTESSDIPDEFLRNEIGTSIFIMGIDDSEDSINVYRQEIVKSVVKNFWYAILKENLTVEVDFENGSFDKVVVNRKKLEEDILPSYEKYDRKSEYSNPRPYYEAVKNAFAFDPQTPLAQSVYFENNHPEFGHAIFYLIKNDQKHDRFIKMRSPRMVVSMDRVAGKRGFNGVLVCDDQENNENSWDKLLKQAEPPAHDKWEKKIIRGKKTIDDSTKRKAEQALEEISKWVNDCIALYFNEAQDYDMDFYGIKDLLYTDKDLESNSRHEGNASSQIEGISSSGESDFGIATSRSLGVDTDSEVKVRPIASVTAVRKTIASPDPKGKLLGKKRRKHHINPNPNPENGPGTKVHVSPNNQGKVGHYREIFDVVVNCFLPSGQDQYTMVIVSKRKIEKAMVELTTGAAIGTIDVPVTFSDMGTCDNNKICDIPLEIGTNVLHFKFNDKISHKVTVETYEFK